MTRLDQYPQDMQCTGHRESDDKLVLVRMGGDAGTLVGADRWIAGRREDAQPRVLIVDDDVAIRETVRFLLEDIGYEVSEAPDGMAALRRMREGIGTLVVLLDMMMPRMDGASVLRTVADDPRLARRCAFIVTTADMGTVSLPVKRLLDRLDVPVVYKPFDIYDLLVVVEQAMGRLVCTRARSTSPLSSLDDDDGLVESSG